MNETFIIIHVYSRHWIRYSSITTLVIWDYNEKEVVFADISNPNTSKSKFIDFITTVNKWAEIAFSARQNAENEHCETLKHLVLKLNLRHWTCLHKTLNWYSCITTEAIWVYNEKEVVFADNSNPNIRISIIIDLIRSFEE